MRKTLLVLYPLCLVAVFGFTARFNHDVARHPYDEAREVDNIASKKYWEYLRLRDPKTGEIPRGIHARELAYARTLVPRSGAMVASGEAAIHTTGWTAAGPMNAGGRTQAVAIDISNEANVLIATAQGGIWRSTDSGMNWTRATAPDELKNTVSIVQDHRPGKTNVWYAGTGELLSTTERRVSATVGAPRWRTTDVGDGIYKSSDDGKSWFLLASTHDASEIDLDSTFDGVWNIVVDNSNKEQDIVYAAAFGEIMRSSDGGSSWKPVLGDKNHRSFCTDIQITSTGVLYAFLSQYSIDGVTPAAAGVWRSTDGIHWTNISPGFWPGTTQRLKIAIAPSNENALYIAGSLDSGGSVHGMYKYTYVSGDGTGSGGRWEDRSSSLPSEYVSLSPGSGTLGGYAVALKVYPRDENIVIFGGSSLFRSLDGFATPGLDWIGGYSKSGGQPMYTNHHPDNHDVTFSYAHPEKAYSANDGGIYLTENILDDQPTEPVTWQNINNGDMASMLYCVGINHATPGDSTIIGGFQDQGCWIGHADSLWDFTPTGDGCFVAMGDHQYSYYMTSQFGNIYQIIPSRQLENDITPSGGFNGATFVAPWLVDPTDSNVIFLSAGDVVVRNPAAARGNNSWQTLSYTQLDNSNATVTAFAVSVKSPKHMLFYGTSDGHLFKVDDVKSATAAATEITGQAFPQDGFISCVCVDPENAGHIITCFSNYHVVSLFASDDGGTNWRNISGNLEQHPDGSGDGPSTRWVSIVHRNGQTIYLCATSVGMFSTDDIQTNNTAWIPEGLATIGRVICENIDVRQSDGFVAVATQGAGVFTTYIAADSLQTPVNAVRTGISTLRAFTVSPNPANGRATVSVSLAGSERVRLALVDPTGRKTEEIYDGIINSGSSRYYLDASRLPSGTYYVELMTDRATETRRIVITH